MNKKFLLICFALILLVFFIGCVEERPSVPIDVWEEGSGEQICHSVFNPSKIGTLDGIYSYIDYGMCDAEFGGHCFIHSAKINNSGQVYDVVCYCWLTP